MSFSDTSGEKLFMRRSESERMAAPTARRPLAAEPAAPAEVVHLNFVGRIATALCAASRPMLPPAPGGPGYEADLLDD